MYAFLSSVNKGSNVTSNNPSNHILWIDRSRAIGALQLAESLFAAGQRGGLLSRAQLHCRRLTASSGRERGVLYAALFDAWSGAQAPVSTRYGGSSDSALSDGPSVAWFAPRSLSTPRRERCQPLSIRCSLVPHFIRVTVSTRICCSRLW